MNLTLSSMGRASLDLTAKSMALGAAETSAICAAQGDTAAPVVLVAAARVTKGLS